MDDVVEAAMEKIFEGAFGELDHSFQANLLTTVWAFR